MIDIAFSSYYIVCLSWQNDIYFLKAWTRVLNFDLQRVCIMQIITCPPKKKKKKNSHVQNKVQTQTVSDKSLNAENLFHTAGCLIFHGTFERLWEEDIFDFFFIIGPVQVPN